MAAMLWGIATNCHAQPLASLEISRVVIDSAWGGLNPDAPFRTHIVLERDGTAYRLTGVHSKGYGASLNEQAFPSQAVPVEKVERLVNAMRAPAQAQIDLNALQPAIGMVQDRIDWMLGEAQRSKPPALLAKIRGWRDDLRDPQVLARTLTKGFAATHTDDYPSLQVAVTLSNGSMLSARSASQQYLMLPWLNADGARTYDPALPRAVDALLPVESANKQRLEGSLEKNDLDELLGFGLHVDLERFDVEAEAPEALRLLDSRFKVIEVSIMRWNGRQIDAELQLPDGAPNLVLSTRLILAGTSLAKPRDIDRIAQQLALVQSSPAMIARMKAKPSTDFRIQDGFGWRWLNKETAGQFVRQMQAMKKLPELSTTPSLMRNAVMVEEGRLPIYWIVLSDRRAVLWKQYSSESVPAGSTSCEAIPIAVDEPLDSKSSDTCIGEVYDTDGHVQ